MMARRIQLSVVFVRIRDLQVDKCDFPKRDVTKCDATRRGPRSA